MALVQASAVKAFAGDSASSDASTTLSGVTAGNTLIAYVAIQRYSTSTPGLLTAVASTIGGTTANTWQIAKAQAKVKDEGAPAASYHQTESIIAVATNVAGGNTTIALDFVYEDGGNVASWFVEEWSGLAKTSIVNGIASGTGAHEATSTTTGNTGTLGSTDDLALSLISGMFLGAVNGGSPETASSGWTTRGYQLVGTVLDGRAPMHAQSKQLASASAISASWTHDTAFQGTAAVLVTLKSASTAKRIKISGMPSTVDGTTGWEVMHWTSHTDGATFRLVLGISAEASGGTMYVTGATVPNLTAGTVINCVAGRPGESPVDGLVYVVQGVIEDY